MHRVSQAFHGLVLASAGAALAACGGSNVPMPPTAATASAKQLPPPGKLFSWLQPGIDSTHVANNTSERKLKHGNVSRLKTGWTFTTGAGVAWPVLTEASVAYANSGDGYLYAINIAKGTQKWSFQTAAYGERALTSPAVAGALVYAGCNVGGSSEQQGLCALNRSSGKLSWSWYEDCNCQPSAFMLTGPVVSGTTIVFGYYTGGAYGKDTLVALDAATGTPLWQVTAGDGNNSLSDAIPAIDGDNIYAGTDYGLCSLHLSNGTVNWCNGPNDYGISPAVSGGVVYAGTVAHGFYAFDESSGTQIWQYSPSKGSSGYYDPPAVSGSTVYFSTISSGPIYALNAADGSLKFTAGGGSFYSEFLSSPSVANGVLYAACYFGLCAYDASTGAALFASGGLGASSPTIASGRVYLGCGANRSSGVNDVCMYHL